MNKSGAFEWTVGRLMSLVLLIVFLILVIYGVSSGGLNPLIEKVQGKIDEVMIMFGADDGESEVNMKCITSQKNIEGVGSGALTQCRDKCTIVMDGETGGYAATYLYDIENSDFGIKVQDEDSGKITANSDMAPGFRSINHLISDQSLEYKRVYNDLLKAPRNDCPYSSEPYCPSKKVGDVLYMLKSSQVFGAEIELYFLEFRNIDTLINNREVPDYNIIYNNLLETSPDNCDGSFAPYCPSVYSSSHKRYYTLKDGTKSFYRVYISSVLEGNERELLESSWTIEVLEKTIKIKDFLEYNC